MYRTQHNNPHGPNYYFFKHQKEKSHSACFPRLPPILALMGKKGTLRNEHTAQRPQGQPGLVPCSALYGWPLMTGQSAMFAQSSTGNPEHCILLHGASECLSNPLASFDLGSAGNPIPTPTCLLPRFSHDD